MQAGRCPLSIQQACPSIHRFVSTNDLEQHKEDAVTAALRAVYCTSTSSSAFAATLVSSFTLTSYLPPSLIHSQSSLGPSIIHHLSLNIHPVLHTSPSPSPSSLPGHTPTHRTLLYFTSMLLRFYLARGYISFLDRCKGVVGARGGFVKLDGSHCLQWNIGRKRG